MMATLEPTATEVRPRFTRQDLLELVERVRRPDAGGPPDESENQFLYSLNTMARAGEVAT
jgi:hypothetical protein